MVLSQEITRKICNFIYKEPRTIQEIAQYINKNWKTAERYVEKIAEEQGTITMKTFRGGTRGALKLVYWANTENIHSFEFQKNLFKKIELGRKKYDFSPLDLYQHIDNDKRDAFMCQNRFSFGKGFIEMLKKADSQILSFSGNISWINYEEDGTKAEEIVEKLMKRNVKFKIVSRVDVASIRNIDKLLDIQNKLGKDLVEI